MGREAQTNMEETDGESHCREWKLTTVDPQERSTWRSGVRSAMPAASQLLERGPLMWMMPLHLHVNQKSHYDDDDDDILPLFCPDNVVCFLCLLCVF